MDSVRLNRKVTASKNYYTPVLQGIWLHNEIDDLQSVHDPTIEENPSSLVRFELFNPKKSDHRW